MGDDEYHPISHKGSNLTAAGGIGYTVIDSIDTMLLMGLHDEYARARKWVEDKLSFDRDAEFNTFEVRPRSCRDAVSIFTSATDYNPCIGRLVVGVSLDAGRAIPREGERARGPYHACLRDTFRTSDFEHQPGPAERSPSAGQQRVGQHCGGLHSPA